MGGMRLMRRPVIGRGLWFWAGAALGITQVEVLSRGATYLLDTLLAMDFAERSLSADREAMPRCLQRLREFVLDERLGQHRRVS